MRWLLSLLVTGTGCFWHARGGYLQPLPAMAPGGGLAEVSAGLGDVRSKPTSAWPEHLSVDVVAHTGSAGQRLGLGVSGAWVPLSGWAHDWSPQVRLGFRGLQAEWLASMRPVGGLSGLLEVGVVFFPSHATRGRAFFSVSAAGEGFVRYGLPLPPGFMLSLLLGVGFGNSIGPTS